METKKINLGRVGLVPKGAYSPDVTYGRLHVVTYRNTTYCSKQEGNTGHEPVGEDEWWSILVDGQAAYDAAEAAQTAAQTATTAADNANTEALAAHQSATRANTASDKLNAALDKVTEATNNANGSAESARSAAARAQTAAEHGEAMNKLMDTNLAELEKTTTAFNEFNATATAAEKKRTTAEMERSEAEQGRETAETQRTEAENARSTAETTRKDNETLRADAETRRVAAETMREKAEKGRAEKTSQALDAVKTATDAALDAARSAQTAASNAEQSATAANKVNATLAEDGTLTITDREGHEASINIGEGEKVKELVTSMERVKESLGHYTARPAIVLTPSEQNVAISADGVKVAKTGWAIAEFTAELGNEYLFKPGATDGNVCVFAEYIDKIERRAIEYTYTYDETGRIATAKATYEGKTHSYTYAYDADAATGESCVITDDQTGQTVDYLPATFQTTVGSYQPMTLLNADAELPEDGYCRFVSNFQSRSAIKVVVSYKVDLADLTMKVVRDGMTASMCTQLSKINQKVDENKVLAESLRKKISLFGDAFAGFARVSGDGDPKPSDEYIYGNRKLVQEIGKHMKLGTVKREGNEAVLQHECAKGRITMASNGDAVAVDGTEGDLLIYTDIPLYLMKANEQLDGSEMSCLGVGVVPCYWQSHTAKKLAPFAMSPFYTVVAKLESDERSCSHCIINDTVKGTYIVPNGMLKDVFYTDGGGYPTYAQSGIMSMKYSQAKNADANTNYPYMGNYYEFYELWITMMYAECSTLDTTDLYCMGVGCTQQEVVNESTWNNDRIAANSGVKIFGADGTVVNYGGLMDSSLKKGADGTGDYNIAPLVGQAYYTFTKNGEALTVLDGITKGGLQAKVGNSGSIFHFDASGNLVCTDDGSIDLTTGTGMEAAKRYYIVRDVPNCQGIADGVMTAVVNCYMKMNIADGVYNKTTDLTGGYIIYKFSHSLYRGLSIPMDGMLLQLCGAYYTVSKENGKLVNKFYCAEKWQDLPPLVDNTCYTDVANADNLDITRGLSYKKNVPGSSGWAGMADYGTSLFCFTAFDGSRHKKEVCYITNSGYCWGQGENGLPEEGKFCVKGFVVGCYASLSTASARSVYGYYAISHEHKYYAGAFSVPQLKFK